MATRLSERPYGQWMKRRHERTGDPEYAPPPRDAECGMEVGALPPSAVGEKEPASAIPHDSDVD
jgi:hypothetical protein